LPGVSHVVELKGLSGWAVFLVCWLPRSRHIPPVAAGFEGDVGSGCVTWRPESNHLVCGMAGAGADGRTMRLFADAGIVPLTVLLLGRDRSRAD
jgi:hypothetical protein